MLAGTPHKHYTHTNTTHTHTHTQFGPNNYISIVFNGSSYVKYIIAEPTVQFGVCAVLVGNENYNIFINQAKVSKMRMAGSENLPTVRTTS